MLRFQRMPIFFKLTVLYLHKGSSVNSYITSTNIAGVNHTNFINEDPNGDLRFFC